MASFEFDRVKAEKADAVRRYRRNRLFAFCLNLFVTVSLLWWLFSLIPVVQALSAVYLSVLNKHYVVFGLVNTLVFLIYNFSISNTSNDTASDQSLYDQYVSFSNSRRKTPSDGVIRRNAVLASSEAEIVEDKQIVHVAAKEESLVRDATASDIAEGKQYKRTLSDKKRKSQRRVLRRSETEINGREIVVVSGGGGERKSIKDMNNEEFRLTIESFIASKRKTLRDENFAVLMEEDEKQESFTAVTLM